MSLGLSIENTVPSTGIDPNSGLTLRTTYGRDVSFSHATFPPGYASAPHGHESEELSQLIEGELSVYLDGVEYRLREGDFFRVPALAVHWKKNHSLEPAVALELHSAPRGGVNGASLLDSIEREDGAFGAGPPVRFGQTYRASKYLADGEAEFPEAPTDSPLLARSADVWAPAIAQPLPNYHGSAGTNKGISIRGERMSILYSERVGLKARPHFHAAEQLSYVVSGEVWTFVDDRVIYSKAGDVIRVPGNIVHWALVEPGQTAVTFEVHTPIQGDPSGPRWGTWLVPEHRIPHVSWIPGGFPTAALPAEELEAYESGLIESAKESVKLTERIAPGIKPTGARL